MSSQLIWQLINKHNSFKNKGRTGNRVVLSSEPGNLYNKHSYKYSGLANDRTIDIQPAEEDLVTFTTRRPKNKNRPSQATRSHVSKQGTRLAAKVLGKQAARIRPDLQKAAKARISAIGYAQRKQKAVAAKN